MEDFSSTQLRAFITYEYGGVTLDLRLKRLSKVPDAVTELSELEVLRLNYNYLTELPTSINKLKNLKRLYLNNNKLSKVPDAVTELSELEVLRLNYNYLTELPTSINKLKNLKRLYLNNNKLSKVPDAVTELSELEVLRLNYNYLTQLPTSINKLKNLKWLHLDNNKLSKVPDAVTELSELEVLRLDGNNLTGLPTSINKLKNLKRLYLHNNKLSKVPDAVTELSELEVLRLDGNNLTELPTSINKLKNLKWLYLHNNKLSKVPDAVTELSELEVLWLNDNNLTELPTSMGEMKELRVLIVLQNPFTIDGMRSLLKLEEKKKGKIYIQITVPAEIEARGPIAQLAYQNALRDGAVRVYHSRLLLIGQDRAGKTSLKKSLLGLPFEPKEQSTEGIEVDPSTFQVDVDNVKNWQSIDENKQRLLGCSKDVAQMVVEKLQVPDKLWDREEKDREKDDEQNIDNEAEKEEDDSFMNQVADPKIDTDSVSEHTSAQPELMVDTTSPPDEITKHAIQLIKYVKGKRVKEESVVSMEVWDFAGQHLYYASHPIFFSPRAIYILVFNLSKSLNATAQPCVRQGTCNIMLDNPNEETNIENLQSWLSTVHSITPMSRETNDNAQRKLPHLHPPVFIVGTHADKPFEDIPTMKSEVQGRIAGKEYEGHVVRPIFSIDNTARLLGSRIKTFVWGTDENIDAIQALQNKIMEVLRPESYMGEKIPVRWLNFEKIIDALLSKQIFHMNVKQLQTYAKDVCFITDKEEFITMLNFYHDLGMIIKHHSTVILKAQWLIDLFRQLITIPHFNKAVAELNIDVSEHKSTQPELIINATSLPDEITNHANELIRSLRDRFRFNTFLVEEKEEEKEEGESIYTVDLWDFAGQHLYYASHPVFFSLRAIYVLVYNLSKPLNSTAQPCVRQGIYEVILENSNGETNVENLLSWLATVHSINQMRGETIDSAQGRPPYLRPPVIIVGTHADKPFEDIESTKTRIQKIIARKEYERHVVRPIFSIDNTVGSQPKECGSGQSKAHQAGTIDGIQALQDKIMEVLKEEPYMGEKIPVRWLNFEKIIDALLSKQIFHMNVKQLQTYAKDVCFITDKEEFITMLNFYHDLGIIIKHGSTVVLKAQWLIDLFRQLITIPHFNNMDPIVSNHWQEVQKTGVLSMELVDYVFSKFLLQGVVRDNILNMMEQFGLIAKYSPSTTDVKYFVPAQLKAPPDSLCAVEPSSSDPCPLYVYFTTGFVPHGLFTRLVSRSISWCSVAGPTQPPKLYQNAARFVIGMQIIHHFVLICKKQFIKIVLKQITKSQRYNSSEVARKVKEFLVDSFQDLSQSLPYLHGLQFQFCVLCPQCQLEKCANHTQVKCTHSDCLHLLEMKEGKPLMCDCDESLCDEELTVHGLEKWFPQRTSQELNPSTSLGAAESDPRHYDLRSEKCRKRKSPCKEDDAVWKMTRDAQPTQGPAKVSRYEAPATTGQVMDDIQPTQVRQIFSLLHQMEQVALKRTNLELKKIASDKGFMISDNQGGGNCMFHALSEQLDLVKGIKISHQKLRDKVVNYLTKNPTLLDGTKLFDFVDGCLSWDAYLTNMAEDGTWGDHVILHGAANCFGTSIHVISSLCHDLTISPERNVDSSNQLVLGHVHELHYVSLNPLKQGKVKEGCPSDEELEELSVSIGNTWKKLGRRLKFKDETITGFDKENEEYSEKAYQMLLAWKRREGSAATYQVLHQALCHKLVNHRNLAEYCCEHHVLSLCREHYNED